MTVSFEDFKKLELKIGKILEAAQVDGSDKLLKLQIDVGEAVPRQVIAGIGKTYSPENLLGKQLLFIANLEPRMIMGLESQGMILAAQDENGPVVMIPEKPVPDGSALK